MHNAHNTFILHLSETVHPESIQSTQKIWVNCGWSVTSMFIVASDLLAPPLLMGFRVDFRTQHVLKITHKLVFGCSMMYHCRSLLFLFILSPTPFSLSVNSSAIYQIPSLFHIEKILPSLTWSEPRMTILKDSKTKMNWMKTAQARLLNIHRTNLCGRNHKNCER